MLKVIDWKSDSDLQLLYFETIVFVNNFILALFFCQGICSHKRCNNIQMTHKNFLEQFFLN